MRSIFEKYVGFWSVGFFKNITFHERGRRGRSGRQNSGKMIAAGFSRCDFLMVLGSVSASR